MAKIEKLIYGGDGLARIDGRVVFIPYSIPGEDWEEGKLEEAAPNRIQPECEYFGDCGGCSYQHLPYEDQLQQKKLILEEQLTRLGKIIPPPIDIVSGEPWGYRNRIQLHFDGRTLGFQRRGTNKLCPITHCPISSPGINAAIEALNEMAKDHRFPNFLQSVELFTNEKETLVNVLSSSRPVGKRFFEWCAEKIPGATESAIDYQGFRTSHKSFFQVNRFLIDRLVELTLEGASGKFAVDLYAGVGLFSRTLAKMFDRVLSVEVVRSAIADLEVNVPQVAAIQESTEDFLATLDETPDFILADPPRSGLGKRTVDHLLRLKAPQLHIVSCDPATLARDLQVLTAGGYKIEKMTLVDLFPQTYHIESVTRLRHE